MAKSFSVQKFRVECPQCSSPFFTKDNGAVTTLKCQVCNFCWTEVVINHVSDSGNAAYMSRAKAEHPNISFKNQQKILLLRAVINRIGRYMEPIPCGRRDCNNLLTEMESGILPQLLVGGFPTTGAAPLYCVECAKKFAAERLSRKPTDESR